MVTQEKSIVLGAVAEIDLKGQQVPLLIMIGSDKRLFLMIGSRKFEFKHLAEGFQASYKNTNGDSLNISELLGELIPDIADELPQNLEINLQQVTIAYQRLQHPTSKVSPSNQSSQSKESSVLLLSARLGFDINLADLPLIGDKIPSDIAFALKSFQVTYVSNYLDKASAKPFAADLALNCDRFENDDDIVLHSGINLSAELQFGNDIQFLALPLGGKEDKQAQQTQEKENSTSTNSKTASSKPTSLSTNFAADKTELWLELNKTVGPLRFQKIGVQYRSKEGELWFFLNASLSFGGLTLACNNLGVGSSLTEFKPKFSLDGISICYKGSDDLLIGGAFLRKTRTLEDGTTYEEYSGAAILGTKIKNKKITLTAIGSYTEIDGEASLFVFALLDYPLGGPPAFFVTGLAAGFGYNRTLKVPETVEAVANFPLVRLAMGEQSPSQDGELDLLGILDDLGPYIPPVRDELFFAIGVKFTSFKLVEAFVLLIVKLGKKLEIHVLGLATLTAPPIISGISDDIEPVAQARLAIKAVFIPDDGILRVEAVLAEGSYIFSKKCYLSGGFAFYTWFSGEHEGDFVLTLGGYHPEFKVPQHYPQVPRVQLSWKLNEYLSIKGFAYFAITPSALMVGGGLEAAYRRGDVQAWFKIEANFLVAWQPFFYTADVSVEIGASVKIKCIFEKTISLNIKASLQIWGPPFAGRAQFEVGPIDVEITFGDGNHPRPKALTWSEFQQSLLPAKEEVCSISISDGLLNKKGESASEVWIVNAKELVLVTESAIPSSSLSIKDIQEDSLHSISSRNKELAIRPMGVTAKELTTIYRIDIFRDQQLVNQEFQFKPIYKSVPSALWKASTGPLPHLPPDPNEEKLVNNALSGFEISPKAATQPGKSQEVDYQELIADSHDGSQYCWNPIYLVEPTKDQDAHKSNIEKMSQMLTEKANNERRQHLLNSLDLDLTDITITNSFVEDLLGSPSLVSLAI